MTRTQQALTKEKEHLNEVDGVQLCFRNKGGRLVWMGGDYSAPSQVQSQGTEPQSKGTPTSPVTCIDEAGDPGFTISTDHQNGSTLLPRDSSVNVDMWNGEVSDRVWKFLKEGGGFNC